MRNPNARSVRLLLAISVVCLLLSTGLVFAHTPTTSNSSVQKREFWVWDLNVMPPGFRKIQANPVRIGNRSLIYLEENFLDPNLTEEFLDILHYRLEIATPKGSLMPNKGIVSLEESVFGPLPKKSDTDDDRVIILFANLGKYKDHQFDGFFNAFDQISDKEAWEKYQQHSNEANIVYINGFRSNQEYTIGVIAHELQHLLAHAWGDASSKDLWLSEALAEGAMLLTGYYTDQDHINRYALETKSYPLVSHNYVQYGPQLLFASFLLDSVRSSSDSFSYLTKLNKSGRDAIEDFFRNKTNSPLTFDSIFSNFLTYIFKGEGTQENLPSFAALSETGIKIPRIHPSIRFTSFPASAEGSLYPYSFLTVEMDKVIPPSAVIKVSLIPQEPSADLSMNCANASTVLWKPVDTKRIAIYSVGCEPQNPSDKVFFRLSILDKPFTIAPNLFRIFP
ncbi:MAG: hypothetical protein M9962_14505 [Oligoflexia bacterium]|nr:hypothetical protein [Oligoflexia bacterium]